MAQEFGFHFHRSPAPLLLAPDRDVDIVVKPALARPRVTVLVAS